QLLPPLPPGRAPRRADRHLHQPCRLSLCRSRREQVVSSSKDRDETRQGAPNRRSMLLGGTTLAAASALAAGAPGGGQESRAAGRHVARRPALTLGAGGARSIAAEVVMSPRRAFTRRSILAALSVAALCGIGGHGAFAQSDPLPSWNDGAAKTSIVDFVARATTPG